MLYPTIKTSDGTWLLRASRPTCEQTQAHHMPEIDCEHMARNDRNRRQIPHHLGTNDRDIYRAIGRAKQVPAKSKRVRASEIASCPASIK